MKDELPDLTPYLNKKGGNSQGRGEEPADKTDISQKLSALVKKPGNTGSHPSLQSSVNTQAVQSSSPDPNQDQATGGERQTIDQSRSTGTPNSAPNFTPNFTSNSTANAASEGTAAAYAQSTNDSADHSTDESDIGIIRPPATRAAADNQASGQDVSSGSNGQEPDSSSSGGSASVSAPSADTTAAEDSSSRWRALTAPASQSWQNSSNQQGSGLASDNATRSDSAFSRSGTNSPPAVPRGEDNYAPSPSRDMAKPGQSSDKLRAPQSKPMSTLSSSNAPPLLKTPPKQPGRPAQPYNYRPVIESGKEAMAPRGPSSAPVNKGPQPVAAPRPPMPQPSSSASNNSSGPADRSAPASSMPQPRPVPSATRPEPQGQGQQQAQFPSQSQLQPQLQSQSQPRIQPQPQAQQPSAPRVESEAEKLARAFMEEAKALQDSSGGEAAASDTFAAERRSTGESKFGGYEQGLRSENYQNEPANFAPTPLDVSVEAAPNPVAEEPEAIPHSPREAGPRSSLSSLFDSGVLNSRSESDAPKKPLGFGDLLAGAARPQEEDKHTTFSDLMVPTGEHDALFAPDRREASGTSAFDEITAQVNADEEAVIRSLSGESFSEPPAGSAPLGMGNKSQPPAFSSLFSSEIVTSGQDFSNRGGSASSPAVSPDSSTAVSPDSSTAVSPDSSTNSFPLSSFGDTARDTDSDLLEPIANQHEDDSRSQSPKSLAISKLIQAVNQDESPEYSSNYSSDFSSDRSSDFSSSTTGDTDKDLFSSETANHPGDLEDPSHTPDIGALSPSALEALASFVPKVGEEQHETKGLLAKLKAKDAAVKAAQKTEAAKKDGASEAKATGTTEAKAEEESKPSAPSPGSLAALLSKSQPVEEVKAPAPAPQPEPEPTPEPEEDDQSSGNSLGDAISDALDKLLSEDGETIDTTGEAKAEVPSAEILETPGTRDDVRATDSADMSSSLSKLLDDDPDRFNRPIGGNMKEAEEVLAAVIAASVADPSSVVAQPVEAHPLTLTNSKVDALSRLLEVASKAPHKPAEEKTQINDSSNRLSEMINKPPGKISRQMETMDAPAYSPQGNQPQQESYTSPFGGGTSPFSSPGSSYSGPGSQPNQAPANSSPGSPFGTPVNSTNSGVTLNHTPAGGFNPTSQSQPPPSGFSGTGSMSDMPKASGIASDAISARIAALNRKLEEQTKSPGASGTVNAMTPTGPSLAPPPDYPPPPPMTAPPLADFVPNPIVDDSPQTRAELVNRILGSAKISQTALPDLPTRNMAEMPIDQQISQMHLPKGQKNPAKSKARARGHRSGINPWAILLVIALFVIVGLVGYLAIKDGHIKGLDLTTLTNLTKPKGGETKVTVEQLIKSGDLDKAVEMLEAKKESGKFSSGEAEKLYGLYFQLADKAVTNDDPAEAVKLLEKIPSRTRKFKDAQKLLRKLKKKAKKN